MYTMQHEVQGKGRWVIRKIVVQVEQEAVQEILQQCPDEIAEEEEAGGLDNGRQGDRGYHEKPEGSENIHVERGQRVVTEGELQYRAKVYVGSDRHPNYWYDIPSRLAEYLYGTQLRRVRLIERKRTSK